MITLLALTGGCAGPAGSDGDVMNGWKAMPAPTPYQPAAQGCYQVTPSGVWTTVKLPDPVDCAESHNLETVLVGAFTGADAARTSPPPAGGGERRRAYEQCMTAATAFLGADWHTGRVDLGVMTPRENQWEGGARWYRCDLVENGVNNSVSIRTASLKGTLTGAGSMAIGCVRATEKGDNIVFGGSLACDQPHEAEYAGVFTAPDGPYPADAAASEKLNLAGCGTVVAKFAGVPDDRNLTYRTGLIYEDPDNAQWLLGDRGTRCYIWPGKLVSRSLKGAGPGVLPAQ